MDRAELAVSRNEGPALRHRAQNDRIGDSRQALHANGVLLRQLDEQRLSFFDREERDSSTRRGESDVKQWKPKASKRGSVGAATVAM